MIETVHEAINRANRLIKHGRPDKALLDAIRTVSGSTMSLADAQAAIVEHYVAKWGEAQRAASERLVRRDYPTLGLALNRLAYWDIDAPDMTLAARALLAMTDSDVTTLRRGG